MIAISSALELARGTEVGLRSPYITHPLYQPPSLCLAKLEVPMKRTANCMCSLVNAYGLPNYKGFHFTYAMETFNLARVDVKTCEFVSFYNSLADEGPPMLKTLVVAPHQSR